MKNTNTEITFELFGTIYTRKANGYCYMDCEQSESGKVHRIGKAEFEAKYSEYEMMEKTLAEIEYAEVEAEITAESHEKAHGSAQNTEEGQEAAPAPEATKKAKKKAKKAKKTAAFAATVDGTEITLTAKQVDFIRHLPDTNFWERGLDSCIWVDCLCDDIGGQFEGKPMTVGAMISTICEKGLGTRGTERRDGRKCISFALTALGKVVAAELGLN